MPGPRVGPSLQPGCALPTLSPAPVPPAQLTLRAPGASALQVSWNDSGVAAGLRLMLTDLLGGSNLTAGVTRGISSHTFARLSPGTPYELTLSTVAGPHLAARPNATEWTRACWAGKGLPQRLFSQAGRSQLVGWASRSPAGKGWGLPGGGGRSPPAPTTDDDGGDTYQHWQQPCASPVPGTSVCHLVYPPEQPLKLCYLRTVEASRFRERRTRSRGLGVSSWAEPAGTLLHFCSGKCCLAATRWLWVSGKVLTLSVLQPLYLKAG